MSHFTGRPSKGGGPLVIRVAIVVLTPIMCWLVYAAVWTALGLTS